jgi:hypothetical protein
LGLTPLSIGVNTHFESQGVTVKLTLGQVRAALDLSQDAYRHWKSVLEPLSLRKGHKPCFSHGDLLALAVVKTLTDEVGIPVGCLAAVAGALFEQCSQHSWAKFERLAVFVQPASQAVSFNNLGVAPQTSMTTIIIPCGPIVTALRAALTVDQSEEPQQFLKFPLEAVTSQPRSARGKNS